MIENKQQSVTAKDRWLKKKCHQCKLIYWVIPYRIASKFCSRRCASISCNIGKIRSPKTRERISITKKSQKRFKELSGNWKGGFTIDSDGYRLDNCLHKKEHRAIVEKFIGRELRINEIVHHKDGNKLNNSIENLEIMTRSQHINLHRADLMKGRKYGK